MDRVKGKVCMVTGGALGIGRACCERLADEGGRIAIFDRMDTEGEAVAASLRARGDREPPPGLTSGTFNAPPH